MLQQNPGIIETSQLETITVKALVTYSGNIQTDNLVPVHLENVDPALKIVNMIQLHLYSIINPATFIALLH